MSATGDPDPLYVKAQEVLLDALDALEGQRKSLVLVGAQAIYLHIGEGDIAVAPYTTDADLVVDPSRLSDQPLVGAVLSASGFVAGAQPGEWKKEDVRVDLMVPEAVAGSVGSRGARLGVHGNRAARKARGLEGALVDRDEHEIFSLAGGHRTQHVLVAGPGALLVSKIHKISERIGDVSREKDKDALDVLRILRGVTLERLAERLTVLGADSISRVVTEEALGHLHSLFGRSSGAGVASAVRATERLEVQAVIEGSCVVLTEDLLAAVGWKSPEDR